jgi:hypothetical protein
MQHHQGVYNPPIAHYRHFNTKPEWNDHIAKIIGKDGCHFIRMTMRSGCKYIWYNEKKGVIELWGPHGVLRNAQRMIEQHIDTIVNETA